MCFCVFAHATILFLVFGSVGNCLSTVSLFLDEGISSLGIAQGHNNEVTSII